MRLVDADAIDKQIGAWIGQPGYGDYYTGYDNALCAIRDLIADMPTLTPPNEPLTLEELRKMDGEPLWGKSLITDKPGEWFILRVLEMSKIWFMACTGAEQWFGDKDTYGKTWLAYRRPLAGGNDK